MSDVIPRRELVPYRIGALIDLPEMPGLSDVFVQGLEFAFEEAHEAGLIDRPVKVIVRNYFAHPWDDGRPNVLALRDLVENEGVLGIAGPMTTDNSLAVLPEIERLKVPNMTICGTQLYVGHYAFNLSNGGMGDEPAIMVAWLKGNGHGRLAVIRESPSQIGEEYAYYMRFACQAKGIRIVAEEPVSPNATLEECIGALKRLRESSCDSICYLGLGGIAGRLTEALSKIGWAPPRVMTTAFCGATYSERLAHLYEGWVGVDQYDERNTVLSSMVERYRKKKGTPIVANSATSCGYDIGRAFSLGLARMRISTPAALRDALETIRRMPAATGAPRTVITFGPQDHRGFKGPDFLVLRRAEGGKTYFVGEAPVD